MNNLEKYAVSERFVNESSLYPKSYIARVISQSKDLYSVVTDSGINFARISGKMRFNADNIVELPVVGDFVMVDRNESSGGYLIIQHRLSRKSAFGRRAAGTSQQAQIVAANIDIVFICMSLNHDYNLSRTERYLSIAWDSGATPVIVLTKVDLCADLEKAIAQITLIAPGTDIVATSSQDKASYNRLFPYLKKDVTASFIGSSGVGKSTLINCLAGEELLATSGTGENDKGRHTTTRRELLVLPQGGIVIDTPGMREIGVESADLSSSFSDIDDFISQCRFSNCSHTSEPGCAVKKALDEGLLDRRRFDNYKKLEKEAGYEGLSSKQIENKKLSSMFSEFGGFKNAKKMMKSKSKQK